MQSVWKLIWDITAVVVGAYAAWKVFLYFGELVPGFGYFPIGALVGLLTLGVVAWVVHAFELPIDWIIWKTLKIRMAKNLPFD